MNSVLTDRLPSFLTNLPVFYLCFGIQKHCTMFLVARREATMHRRHKSVAHLARGGRSITPLRYLAIDA